MESPRLGRQQSTLGRVEDEDGELEGRTVVNRDGNGQSEIAVRSKLRPSGTITLQAPQGDPVQDW